MLLNYGADRKRWQIALGGMLNLTLGAQLAALHGAFGPTLDILERSYPSLQSRPTDSRTCSADLSLRYCGTMFIQWRPLKRHMYMHVGHAARECFSNYSACTFQNTSPLAPRSGICKPSRVVPKEIFASLLHGSHMRAVYLSLRTGSVLTACKE